MTTPKEALPQTAPTPDRRGPALWGWWLVAGGVALAVVSPVLPDGPQSVLHVLAIAAAVAAAALGVHVNHPEARRPWQLVVAALTAALVSQVAWVLGGSGGHERDLSAYVASAVGTAGYVAILGAVLFFVTRGGDRPSRQARLLDATLVATATAFTIWNLGGEWALAEAPRRGVEIGAGVGYVVLVTAVAVAAVPMLRRQRDARPSSTLLGIGIVLQVLTAVAFTITQATDVELPWAALLPFAVLAGAAAALHPTMRRLGVDAPPEDDRLTNGRLVLYGLALVLPVVIVALGQVLLPEPRQASGVDISVYLAAVGVVVLLRLRLMFATNRRAEERLRQYFALPLIGIVVSDLDRRTVDVNEEVCRLLGRTREEMLGLGSADITHPDDVGIDAEQFAALLRGDIESYIVEKRYVRPDGQVVFARNSKRVVRHADGSPDYVLGLIEDVTDRHESEARYEALVAAAGDGIISVVEGRVVSFNRAAERMTGWAAEEIIGHPAAELLSPEQRPGVRAQALRAMAGGNGRGETVLVDARRRDGTTYPAEITITQMEIAGTRVSTGIARDVSERRRLEEQLTHQALHDPLTGLANRTLLLDRIERALVRGERSGRWPALLFLDLDRFKVINDSLGHDVGDELLMVIAHRLSAELRGSDTAARLGGDEFVVLGEEMDQAEAEALAGRLLHAIGQAIELDHAEVVVTASIGLIIAEPGTTAADLLSAADASMYRAKADGRNRVHVFDESVREAAQVRLRIESGLRRALEHDELELWFQPQYAVGDHHMVGAEALLRWHHPTDGLLGPDQFLDIAEEVGLDLAIDEWVVTTAARHVRRWVDLDPDFVVWVNISARGLGDAGLPGMILAALAGAGVGPGNLGLEVTERALIRDLDLAARSLDTLRGAGLRIAIDDFGTGFSSLAWLERLPLDVLKVDRSFTEGLGVSRDSAVIVRSVVAMAHSLGLDALAEGVETEHQLALLREIGCDSFQGYLAGRPVPAGQLTVAPASLVATSVLSR